MFSPTLRSLRAPSVPAFDDEEPDGRQTSVQASEDDLANSVGWGVSENGVRAGRDALFSHFAQTLEVWRWSAAALDASGAWGCVSPAGEGPYIVLDGQSASQVGLPVASGGVEMVEEWRRQR